MMKFFRKYNKQLLSVFMVLLMIVFIGGSALESLMAPTFNPVVGTSSYGKITQIDQRSALDSTNVLTNLGYRWQYPLGLLGEPLTVTDWVLLTREAQSLGTSASLTAAKTWITDRISAEQIDQFSRNVRIKPDSVYRAFGELKSIQDAARAVAAGSSPSAAQIRTTARNALDKVQINVVVLPAEAFVDETSELSDDELLAHLEAYREVEPGQGLHFGYYIVPAVKTQYIKIDRAKIEETIAIPNLEREARSYYRGNTQDRAFIRPAGQTPEPAEGSGGAETAKSGQLSWEEAKDIAIGIVRRQRAEETVDRIASWLVDYTLEAFLEVPRSDAGYKPATAKTATLGYYEELIERLPPRLQHADAVTVHTTGFFRKGKALADPLLQAAAARDSGGRYLGTLRTLAFQTESIVPDLRKVQGARFEDYLSTYQTCLYPLGDREGNKYVFRVIDSKPGHPAESVDEVRDELVAGLQLLMTFQEAYGYGETLLLAAQETDLRDAFDNDVELQVIRESPVGSRIAFVEPPPFSRTNPRQAAQGWGKRGTFVTGVGWLPRDAVERCFAMETSHERIAVMELEDQATIILVEWTQTTKGREDEFDAMKKNLISQLADNQWRQVVTAWLDPEQIRARTGFVAGPDQ